MEVWVMSNKAIPGGMTKVNTNYNYTGVSDQNYVVWPFWGGWYPNDAGSGISVGTNGVAVIEHCDNYMPALLVYYTSIPNNSWIHIAVVHINRKLHQHINGTFIKSVLTSNIGNLHPGSQLGD